jgi:hypothetical protein
VFTAIDKNKSEKEKPEKSMNKNGTESRTYFMLLSINSHYNPPQPTLCHLKDECTFVPFYSLAVQLFGLLSSAGARSGERKKRAKKQPTCQIQKKSGCDRNFPFPPHCFFLFLANISQFFVILIPIPFIYVLSITKIENTEKLQDTETIVLDGGRGNETVKKLNCRRYL